MKIETKHVTLLRVAAYAIFVDQFSLSIVSRRLLAAFFAEKNAGCIPMSIG